MRHPNDEARLKLLAEEHEAANKTAAEKRQTLAKEAEASAYAAEVTFHYRKNEDKKNPPRNMTGIEIEAQRKADAEFIKSHLRGRSK